MRGQHAGTSSRSAGSNESDEDVQTKDGMTSRSVLLSSSLLFLLILGLCLRANAQTLPPLIERLESALTPQERLHFVTNAGEQANSALVDSLRKRAEAFLAVNDYPHATQSASAALAVAEHLKDAVQLGRIYYTLGQVHYLQGQMAPAIELFRKGVDAAQTAGEKRQAGQLFRRIAASQYFLGNITSALEADQQGMKLAVETGDRGLLALISVGLGADYLGLGQYRKSAEIYDEALSLAESTHNEYLQRMILKSLAVLYNNQGDAAVALSYLERMQKMPPATDLDDRADDLRILGRVYSALGRQNEAIQAMNASLQLAQQTGDGRAQVLVRIQVAWMLHHNKATLRDAVNELEQALEISRRLKFTDTTATILRHLAWYLLDLGEKGRSRAMVEESLDLAQQLNNLPTLGGTLNAVGHVYRRLNRREEAERAFRRAIAATETWRGQLAGSQQDARTFMSDQASNQYHELLVMRAEDGDLQGALQLAERDKARQLLDSLSQAHVEVKAVMSEAEKRREQELALAVARANAALAGQTRADAKSLALACFETAAGALDAFRASTYAIHPELLWQAPHVAAVLKLNAAAVSALDVHAGESPIFRL